MRWWVRLILILIAGGVAAIAFLIGFPAIDATYPNAGIDLTAISSGADGQWDKATPSAAAYIGSHVALDAIFMAAYGTFFFLISGCVGRQARTLALIVRAGIVLVLALDVVEDALFFTRWSSPALSHAKLVDFIALVGVTAVAVIIAIVVCCRRKRRNQPPAA